MTKDIRIDAKPESRFDAILTDEALQFVAWLQRRFNARRLELLQHRHQAQAAVTAGGTLDFDPETRAVREGDWQVAAAPPGLENRRVEITGPVERRMMINAFNSGANVFMADLEDSLAPRWDNVLEGQLNLRDAVRGALEYTNEAGRHYTLNKDIATLVVRPRGWHLPEKHLLVDGEAVSASLFDFGLFFFHNAAEALRRGAGPYFYLPKLEHYLEARLWNEVFVESQQRLGIAQGSVRATVLIETIAAAFYMDEILYELREHASGLNAGRWDYIFSFIKYFRERPECVLPDRAEVRMTVPAMRAYADLLVATCHRRGAHAIGGMAAFIPSRKDPAVNKIAIPNVKQDKEREVGDGFDGTWVAHPDLVKVAREVFDGVLGDKPHQKDRLRAEVRVGAAELLNPEVPGGRITTEGVRNNISVALQYINHWLLGSGAVAINHLMEDAATAEISRSQLWQWRHHHATLEDGRTFDAALYRQLCAEELDALAESAGAGEGRLGVAARLEDAAQLLDELVLADDFSEFLTLPAYERHF